MNPPILNVGIVGLSQLGKRHAENLARHTHGARLIAACSPVGRERNWARQELGVHHFYCTLEALLADPDVHAVVLATSSAQNTDQAKACLLAGKHVYVEKPPSLDVASCEEVEVVARDCPNLFAMVGFPRRFDPSYVEAKAAIDSGDLGKPFLVRSQTCDQNDPEGHFAKYALSSGGIFMDCSLHDIDLARWMLGKPKATRVFASGTNALHPELAACSDVDNGLAIVEFDGGQRAVFYASRTMPHGHESTTEVIGTTATLQVGMGAHLSRVQYRDACGVGHRALPDFFARFGDALRLEMQAFISACRSEHSSAVSLNDATEALRIVQAMRHSLRSGMPVHL